MKVIRALVIIVAVLVGFYVGELVISDLSRKATPEVDRIALERSANIKACMDGIATNPNVNARQYCECVIDDYYEAYGDFGEERIDLTNEQETIDHLYPYAKKCLKEQGLEL